MPTREHRLSLAKIFGTMGDVSAQSLLKRFFPLLLVVLLAVPAVHQLFLPNFFSSHDGEGHVIRMEEFYQSFLDGQFPVRWSKRLYYGYGYPFFNFNYPVVYYFGLPLMLGGFSASDAMKAELILTFIASGLFMYLYLRRKIPPAFAVFGSFLYMYAPYRLVNIYVRGSIAETAAFVFPPLLLWAAENIADRKKKSVLWGALVIGLLGVSHNISALIMFGFFFGYVALLSLQRRSLVPLLKSFLTFGVGLMMAAFFFVPALMEKKYTFLDTTIAKDYPNYFITLSRLVAPGWSFGDNLSLNVGWVQLGLMTLAVVSFFIARKHWKTASESNTLFTYCMIGLVAAILLMLPVSKPLWDNLPLLPFVQFPWRFLMITVPVLSIGAALGLQPLARQFRLSSKSVAVLMAVLVITVLFISKFMWNINQQIVVQKVPGDALLGSTTWADEQATQWLVPKPKEIPATKIQALDGQLSSVISVWKTGRHEYTVTALEETTVVENTMYYPGWRVWVDGREVNVDYQNKQFPGRIVYVVDSGAHTVVTRFTETTLRSAVDVISFVTIVWVLVLLIKPNKNVQSIQQKNSRKRKRSRR